VPEVEKLLLDVTENLVPKAVEIFDIDGRRYSLRVRPYRTEDNKIDGVVMVFIDMEPTALNVAAGTSGDSLEGEHRNASTQGDGAGGGAGEKFRRASLLFAQEEERRRLSHELHDELNQRLALLEVTLQTLETHKTEPAELRKQLTTLRKGIAALSDDFRRIAYQLHPSIVEDLGLVAGVQNYCDEFTAREGIQVRFTHRNVPAAIPSALALGFYRIVQEGLRNVSKHSGAKRATVTLRGDDSSLALTIRDSGSGFDPTVDRLKGGLGITGMQERMSLLGGKLEIKSAPGRGSEVTATAPLEGVPKEMTEE
jgi:signal transduction histidine kinase